MLPPNMRDLRANTAPVSHWRAKDNQLCRQYFVSFDQFKSKGNDLPQWL
jgi:hypothetical protein